MKFFQKSKLLTGAAILLLGGAAVAGCGTTPSADISSGAALEGAVTASGSTALLPLLKPAQEEFHQKYDRVTVNIAGGGSFIGLNQVAEGAVQIGNADVNLPAEYQGKGLVDHKVVVMPFVFIVNKGVAVDGLTAQQAVDIMTGRIANWREVGGGDQAITLIHRAKSSGSRATISEVVLKGAAFTDRAVIQDSNGAVKAAIAKTPGAVGYVDAPYADDSVKILAFDGVNYTPQAVMDGKYPVYAYGHMYTKGEPSGAAKAFIDYVMSPEFQDAYVEKTGYIPVTRMKQ